MTLPARARLRAGLQLIRKSLLGCPHGSRESILGLSADTGSIGQPGPRSGTQYDSEYSQKAWDRAISGARAEDDLERVPSKTLGADCRQRLLRDGSVEGIPFGLVGHSLLYKTVGSTRGQSGNLKPNGWTVDDSDCLQDDRITPRDCVAERAASKRKIVHTITH